MNAGVAVATPTTKSCLSECYHPKHDRKRTRRASITYAVAVIAALWAVVFLFFREFWFSKGNLIAGDPGDNYFYIAIMEHWRQVFLGRVADFASPIFFYPTNGVLGFSDSMFLFAVPYVILRTIGFDRFLSFETVLIFMKGIGFTAMYLFLMRYVGAQKWLALVGAMLFAISSMYYVSMPHAQLAAVAFVPVLCILAAEYWRQTARAFNWRAPALLCGAASLEALLLFTSFYVGWFVLFCAAFVTVLAGVALFLRSRSLEHMRAIARIAADRWLHLVLATVVFAVCTVPVLYVYLPALESTGGRSFDETLLNMGRPEDVFNTGADTLLIETFANVFPWVAQHLQTGVTEQSKGWTVLTLIVFVATTALVVSRFIRCNGRAEPLIFMSAVVGVGTILLWLISLKYGAASPWWFVFSYVPGASAIRVTPRLNLVLNVFVIIIVIVGLQLWLRRLTSLGGRLGIAVLCLCLIFEQINEAHTHGIDRSIQNDILSRVRPNPSECRAFYVSDKGHSSQPSHTANIDAMIVAIERNLPTFNGYSGWLPRGWHLIGFHPGYTKSARDWALRHGFVNGLCSLSLASGSWQPVDLFSTDGYALGAIIDFRTGGNADRYKLFGWGEAEPGGSWMLGARSEVAVVLKEIPSTDLLLELEGHAFTPSKRPNFNVTVLAGRSTVANWTATEHEPVISRSVQIPRHLITSRIVRLVFLTEDPKSPHELGLSIDARELGIAVHKMVLHPLR